MEGLFSDTVAPHDICLVQRRSKTPHSCTAGGSSADSKLPPVEDRRLDKVRVAPLHGHPQGREGVREETRRVRSVARALLQQPECAWAGDTENGEGQRIELHVPHGRHADMALILAVVGIILAPIAAKLIQLAISRRREYLADGSGALLTRYPQGLASALEKISNANIPLRHASHATAHLFIDEPFGKPEQSRFAWIERLFSTHPPVQDRIKRLLGSQ